jgi:hypothetical protein
MGLGLIEIWTSITYIYIHYITSHHTHLLLLELLSRSLLCYRYPCCITGATHELGRCIYRSCHDEGEEEEAGSKEEQVNNDSNSNNT